MTLDDMAAGVSEWLQRSQEVIMSSRVRLARNLEGLSFTYRANQAQRKEVISRVQSGTQQSSYLANALFVDLARASLIDRQFLVERHLISKEHALGKGQRAVIIGDKEIVSIMVNEEDHLRLQSTQSGLELMDAWRLIDKIDDELEGNLDYAFSPDLGYLTACPTNTGTGMRASVMLHLPALVLAKEIDKVLNAVAKLSLTVRGIYGEGTGAAGNFFQISNQITLGQSEVEILDNVERVTRQVVGHERAAREGLLKKSTDELSDKIWRAYGTLRNAHIISSKETLKTLSWVRLGIDLGILKDLEIRTVNELLVLAQPGHIQKCEGRELEPGIRDLKRAELIREKLGR